MPSGMTSTTSLADSAEVRINSARRTREYTGVHNRVCDRKTLPKGQGISWQENLLAQLVAENVDETAEYNNPQQITDTFIKLTPVTAVVQTRWTKRAEGRLSATVLAQSGALEQEAMERLKDETYLAVLATASTSTPGAGSVLSHTDIAADVDNITGNTTEPAMGPIHCVLHPFQITDLRTELVVGIGTYTIPSGMSEQTYRKGFEGSVNGANIWRDGNITIDSSDDAKGGTHAQEGIIFVQGFSPWSAVDEKPAGFVGRATDTYMFDEYVYGVRLAAWLRGKYSDATAPA